MNKIFRVVWNQTTQSWVAVSELTKAHKKKSSSDSSVRSSVTGVAKISALLFVLLSTSNAVQAAQVAQGGGSATGSESIAIGSNSKAQADNSIAMGVGANTKPTVSNIEGSGLYGVAIGSNATVQDEHSVAIGHDARNTSVLEGAAKDQVQTAKSAVAIGHNASTHFSGTVAIGHNAEARGHSAIVIGENAKTISPWNDSTNRYAQAYRTTLIGFSAQASGTNTIGMGSHTRALANNAMVFGYAANSGHVDAIVMGREAKTQGSQSASGGSIAIGLKANAGSADNNRPSTAVGANSYVGASFARATNFIDAPEGLDMSRGGTAIGANAGAAFNIVDLLKEQVTVNLGTVANPDNRTFAAGSQVYRHIIRDENNRITDVKYYVAKKEKSDGTGEFTYGYIDADKVNQGYAAFMGTKLDNNEAVLTKAGLLKNGGATLASVDITENVTGANVTTKAYSKKVNTANQQVAIGLQSRAVGNDAIAIGGQAIAGDNSIVVGGGIRTEAFRGDYVKAFPTELASYEAARDQASRKKDIDLNITGSQGTVLSIYQAQVGRNLTNWNAESASYGIGGSTVVGAQAHSTAPIGVAVGISSAVERGALGAVALGPVATVEVNSIGSMAMGMGSRVQTASENSIALGTAAEIVSSNSKKTAAAMALGYKATADKSNSVALGSESNTTTRTATKETEGTISNTVNGITQTLTYSGFKGVPGKNSTLDSGYFVTVGSDTIKRQIKDVAAGKVSSDSTDAINGSQLYAVMDTVTKGWDIAGNDKNVVEAIAPTEKVSFINGSGTTSEVKQDGTNATVTFNVRETTISNDMTAGNAGKVAAAATGSQFATAENVANAINSAYWQAAASGNLDGTNLPADKVKAGTTVTFNAGKNLTVNHSTENNFTFATKDDVEFKTVKLGDQNTYADKNGNPVTKKEDGSFVDANGNPVAPGDVVTVAPVTMKTEAAKPATNNNAEQPTTALNITSADGKPTQIKGVGSVLNTQEVPTSTGKQGDTPAVEGTKNLVNLGIDPVTGKSSLPDSTLNSAATVRDLANMGWVVGAPENGYVDTVKNANKVDFKGENGISVTGKTNDKGVREITISVAEGKVTNDVTVTKADGTVIDGVKGPDGKLYKKGPDGKPDTSKEITLAEGDKVNNEGSKFVSGNAVATAIQESGFTVGKETDASSITFNNADEKVNPNDELRFADGKGTIVSTGTVKRIDEKGEVKTKTVVKVDVDTAKVKANENGSINDPIKDANDAVKVAEEALKANPTDAALQKALDDAKAEQTKAGNKLATASDVATAINKSGWKTNSTTATGGAIETLINPSKAVNFEAGKNMEITQAVDKDGNVTYTYATKSEVEFDKVTIGGGTKTSPVVLNAEQSTPATNNGEQPTKALNITSADGKPTQIKGVGSVLNTQEVPTSTGKQGDTPAVEGTKNLVNLGIDPVTGKSSLSDSTLNSAATVRDLANMGWVVSAKDGNGYVDTVKNANQVEFIGRNGAKVTGETNATTGVREITTKIDTGSLSNNADGTVNGITNAATAAKLAKDLEDARSTLASLPENAPEAVKNAAKAAVFDAENAVEKAGLNKIATVQNVAEAINKSGFTLKTSATADGAKDASSTDPELINPGKAVEMVAGKNMTVKQEANGKVTYATKDDVNFNSVQFGNNGPQIKAGGDQYGPSIQVSNADGRPTRISNVAAGINDTDAVNVSQLKGVDNKVNNIQGKVNNIQGKVNKLGKRMNAGVAGAMAAANLMQPHQPGQSAVMAAVGQHRSQAAVAVGYSRISDNGKYGIKLSIGANTQGEVSSGASVAYFW